MNNATEACRMYVERIKELEARNASMQTVAFQAQEMAKELCARAEAAEARVKELDAFADRQVKDANHYCNKAADAVTRAVAAEARVKELEQALDYWNTEYNAEFEREARMWEKVAGEQGHARNTALQVRAEAAEARAKGLEEALKWYAQEDNWDAQGRCLKWLPNSKTHLADKGQRARQALASHAAKAETGDSK